jgi:drug/metabolite transporter (DMT)-like permease
MPEAMRQAAARAEPAPGAERPLLGLGLGFLGVVVFSLTLPLTRYAVQELDPTFVAFGRMLVAAVAGALTLIGMRAPLPRRADLPPLAMVAGGVVLGFPLFSTLALRTVDASHGGVVLAVLPLSTAVAAVLLARERPAPAFWAWAALGASSVLAFALLRGRGAFTTGDLLLFLACALAALGYAAGGLLARRMPGLQVIAWALLLALPVVIPVNLVLLGRVDLHAGAAAWACFLYVALASQFLGFYFWYNGLAMGGIARVSQVQLLQTFLTLGASALLLGERIDGPTILFALGTIMAVWLGRKARIGG